MSFAWLTMFAIAVGSWIQVPGGDWPPSPEIMREVSGGLRAASNPAAAFHTEVVQQADQSFGGDHLLLAT